MSSARAMLLRRERRGAFAAAIGGVDAEGEETEIAVFADCSDPLLRPPRSVSKIVIIIDILCKMVCAHILDMSSSLGLERLGSKTSVGDCRGFK